MSALQISGFDESRTAAGLPIQSVLRLLADAERAMATDIDLARRRLAQLASLIGDAPDKEAAPAPAPPAGGLVPWQVRRLEAHIDAHLSGSISVPALAALVKLSPSHFTRAFKQSFGETPHASIMRRRVERAKDRMRGTNEPLTQIALACGFFDQSHLSHNFRRLTGTTPHQWRRTHDRD